MFSMKYTSPKAKDAMYFGPGHDLCRERKAADDKGTASAPANGTISEVSSPARYGASTSANTKQSTTSSNADLSDSHDSENDSAVANISQELESRSNFIALLDRQYVSGSSSGEAISDNRNRKIAGDKRFNNTDDDSNDPTAETGCIEGGDVRDIDERKLIGAMPNVQSCKPESTSMNLSGQYSVEYLRSSSMEPFVDVQPESSALTASFIEGDSAEVAVFGRTRQEDSKDREYPSIIDRLSKAGPSSPTIYDMSTEPSSPMMSDINFGPGDDISSRRHQAEATDTEIGGDTYFDEVEKPRFDSIEEDFLLPPRVNRTSSNSNLNPPFLPETFLPRSPHQSFAHAHSLLDDCSDEEEEDVTTLFTIIDSPTRHFHSYSCLPLKKQKPSRSKSHSSATRATEVANENIQQVLLQTRGHRRWHAMSAYAGSHAQSNQVFDISHRAHYEIGCPSENENSSLAASLSVSVEAIRAAALASGLWRTVRIVRLPQGLLLSHSAKVECKECESVWNLLSVLGKTFPFLSEVDFGGDVSGTSNCSDERCLTNDGWRKEVLACIMKCLPKLSVIDGFAVDQCKDLLHAPNMKSRPHERGKKNAIETSSLCGLSDLVVNHSRDGLLNTGKDLYDHVSHYGLLSNEVEKISQKFGNGLSDDSADTVECISEKIMPEVHDKHERLADKDSKFVDEEMKTLPNLSSSSMLSSSQSWGSNNSGRRPPTCPTSASRHRSRLASKSADRKRAKGPSRDGLKRRVLGLIPAVSMMDEDDEDSEGSEVDTENDCLDLL